MSTHHKFYTLAKFFHSLFCSLWGLVGWILQVASLNSDLAGTEYDFSEILYENNVILLTPKITIQQNVADVFSSCNEIQMCFTENILSCRTSYVEHFRQNFSHHLKIGSGWIIMCHVCWPCCVGFFFWFLFCQSPLNSGSHACFIFSSHVKYEDNVSIIIIIIIISITSMQYWRI